MKEKKVEKNHPYTLHESWRILLCSVWQTFRLVEYFCDWECMTESLKLHSYHHSIEIYVNILYIGYTVYAIMWFSHIMMRCDGIKNYTMEWCRYVTIEVFETSSRLFVLVMLEFFFLLLLFIFSKSYNVITLVWLRAQHIQSEYDEDHFVGLHNLNWFDEASTYHHPCQISK